MTTDRNTDPLIQAISPREVEVISRPSPEAIADINTQLRRPWTGTEASGGRLVNFTHLPAGVDKASVIAFYRQAGWVVSLPETAQDRYGLRFFLPIDQRSQS